MIAGSQGVLIPSIWPTTTEYGLLEALALGKPIIAFDIAAHSEFIKNGVHGFLCPLGDFYGFGHNIDVVAELSELDYNEMSNNDIALYKDLSSLNGWRRFIKSI